MKVALLGSDFTGGVADYAKAMMDELETLPHRRERFTVGY